MTNGRIAGAMGAIAAVAALASGAVLYAGQHAAPPVLITDAPPANPLPTVNPAQPAPAPAVPPSEDAQSSGTLSPAPAASARPVADETMAAPAPDAPPQQAGVYVHVAGAVKHPGLYNLPTGSRVASAIAAAGGPGQTADLDAVNLAEIVTDGEKVYIPRKGEQSAATGAGNAIGYASTSPSFSPAPAGSSTGRGAKAGGKPINGRDAASHGSKLTDPSQGTVNVNTATAADLERLPGIGPAMAERILAYRHQNGKFRSINDLREVSGIGDKKLARMAPFVKL